MRVLVLLLLGSTQLCAGLSQRKAKPTKGPTPKALVQIGEPLIDGTTLHTDTTHRDWFEARTFCFENGMTLAAIDGTEKAPILDGSSNTTNFNSYYWTSGRDALSARQFRWDGNPANDDIDQLVKFLSFRTVCTCVVLDAQNTHKVFFHSRRCTDKYGTLCQTAPTK